METTEALQLAAATSALAIALPCSAGGGAGHKISTVMSVKSTVRRRYKGNVTNMPFMCGRKAPLSRYRASRGW